MDEREPQVDLMEKYYKTQKECKRLTVENKELEIRQKALIEKKKEKEKYKYIQEIPPLSKSNPPEIKENIPPSTPETQLIKVSPHFKTKKIKKLK